MEYDRHVDSMLLFIYLFLFYEAYLIINKFEKNNFKINNSFTDHRLLVTSHRFRTGASSIQQSGSGKG